MSTKPDIDLTDILSTLQELRVYQGTLEEDLLLARWWGDLAASGDLAKLIAEEVRSLGRFIQLFQAPNILFYAFVDDSIWLATWLSPILRGAFFNLWIAPQKRFSRQALRLVGVLYDATTRMFPVIFGISKQSEHVEQHAKIGYNQIEAPGLFDGEMTWIHVLTREGFEQGSLYQRRHLWEKQAQSFQPQSWEDQPLQARP